MKNRISQVKQRVSVRDEKSGTQKSASQSIKQNPKSPIKDMTEQYVAPPAHVWKRIEKILDEQDDRKKLANELISSTSIIGNKARSMYLAMGICIATGILLLI